MRNYSFIITIFIASLFSCNKNNEQIDRAFYYWQSNFKLNENEKSRLDSLGIEKLYIKFFDVTWDKDAAQPIPVADIDFIQDMPQNIEYIPVVFITNQSLINIDSEGVKILAFKISKRIDDLLKENGLSTPKEIQFDCDWTESTKEKYFLLLEEIKKFSLWKETILSATIRLHQIKYYKKTGVPPVARGVLMFYNMGNIEDVTAGNSIFDEDIAKSYLGEIDKYPLDLDAAIACFSWGLLFDDQKLIKIFYPLYSEELPDSLFTKQSDQVYISKKNFYFEGQFLVEGNKIKLETIDPATSLKSAELLSAYLKTQKRSVILYHLDPNIINRYSYENFEGIFNTFE